MRKLKIKKSLIALALMIFLSGISSFNMKVFSDDHIDLSRIYPSDDSGIDGHPASRGSNLGSNPEVGISGTYDWGYERFYYMKFDLNSLPPKRIKSATLTLSSAGVTGGGKFGIFKSENDNWNENEITYNNADRGFFASMDNCLVEIHDFISHTTRTFDITEFVREQAEKDQIVTLGFRDINSGTGNFNPYHIFYTKEAAEVSKRPYLSIELYEDITIDKVEFFDENNSDITNDGLVEGEITGKVFVWNNVLDDSASATVVFALCSGTEEDYRIKDYLVVSENIEPATVKEFSANFDVQGDLETTFIRTFIWDSVEGQTPYIPSVIFNQSGIQ